MCDLCNSEKTATMITANRLPAILIGGPPRAGKSVLTYNLTRELRRKGIPHYVFRANPDIEGDWLFEINLETVREIPASVRKHRGWSDEFRDLVCRDLSSRRHLPLIVDLGGLPNPDGKDDCIFRACTHAILLLKDDNQEVSQCWRDITKTHDLRLLAEINSQELGESTLISTKPIIKGTLTQLKPRKIIHGDVYQSIVKCIVQLFSSYPDEVLVRLHKHTSPVESVVDLLKELEEIDSTSKEWTSDLLESLLKNVPSQTALAIYGRGPAWVYGALALHARTEPFFQFDARLGWVSVPILRDGSFYQSKQSPLKVCNEDVRKNQYTILMHPVHNYLDYEQVNQLEFPEPPPEHGVIVSGKLPLWLFTGLARFYADRNVPWIAFDDVRKNEAIVIYSRVPTHKIGETLSVPV